MDRLSGTVVFVTACIVAVSSAGHEWGYRGDTGPSHWSTNYPDCGLQSQSPIDIVTKSAALDTGLSAIVLEGFDVTPANLTLSNNGHTAVVGLIGDLFISGGKLGNKYKAAQFHFHWGKDDSQGSEHTVNGMKYPLEMHIVHYNTKYDSISVAMKKSDGLAVLGLLFKVVDTDNADLDWVTGSLQKVNYKGQQTNITSQKKLREMVPLKLDRYFRYQGSLTTPACYQSVTWTLFAEPIEISHKQIAAFRGLYETAFGPGQSELIENNFRPVQVIGNRKVFASFQQESSALSLRAGSLISLVFCIFLHYL